MIYCGYLICFFGGLNKALLHPSYNRAPVQELPGGNLCFSQDLPLQEEALPYKSTWAGFVYQ